GGDCQGGRGDEPPTPGAGGCRAGPGDDQGNDRTYNGGFPRTDASRLDAGRCGEGKRIGRLGRDARGGPGLGGTICAATARDRGAIPGKEARAARTRGDDGDSD